MDSISLEKKLKKIESYIPNFEASNSKVSKATIGWHIDHSLKVINSVITAMKTSNSASYKNNFNFLGKVLLALGYFPKGKARAPKEVLPPENIEKQDIMDQFVLVKKNIHELSYVDKNAYFQHPMFGHINKKRVIRFLETHTNHHLKIIKSILK
jgi:hypothetical protein